jgi:hypothetical protein
MAAWSILTSVLVDVNHVTLAISPAPLCQLLVSFYGYPNISPFTGLNFAILLHLGTAGAMLNPRPLPSVILEAPNASLSGPLPQSPYWLAQTVSALWESPDFIFSTWPFPTYEEGDLNSLISISLFPHHFCSPRPCQSQHLKAFLSHLQKLLG